MHHEWFDVSDADLDGTQKSFVDTVRTHARSWPDCPPNHTIVLVYDDEEDIEEDGEVELRLIVDVSDLTEHRVLLTLGACLVGNTLLCTEVHNQTYAPKDSTFVRPLEATGSPQELGRIAASWFEDVLRRPVISSAGSDDWSFSEANHPVSDGFRLVRGLAPETRE